MQNLGYENVFIGTVEGEPEETSCEAVIEAVKAAGYTNVVLRPLMVVAGDHANNDMAGADEDSWKTMFEAAGFTVDCQISGLGRIADVQAAVHADFETDSSMFHPNEACNGKGTLTVENGVMTFHVSLASKKIVNLYPGLAADAEANKTAWLIPTVDTVTYADGTTEEVYGYDIPVEALDTDFQLALLGTKGKWYDHIVSVRNAEPKTEQAAETPADGAYTAAVVLEGGSGRATVDSPAALTVAEGKNCHHRVEQPQLRLHDRGRREVSAHQYRGQLHL